MSVDSETLRPRVLQAGLAALRDTLAGWGTKGVLVLTGPSRRYVDRLLEVLAPWDVEVFDGAMRHVPQAVVRDATLRLAQCGADTVISLGGGAATGLGKVLRLHQELHFVAVPTTYAGSEFTSLYGTTDGGTKQTGRNPVVLPDLVLQDPELTLELSARLTTTSLMNSLAHPLSVLSTGAADHTLQLASLDAARCSFECIVALANDVRDRAARLKALVATRLAAGCLESGKLGMHHRLAHALGGWFDLDHSALHALLLPHSVQAMRLEQPSLMQRVDLALAPRFECSLLDLLRRAAAPTSLRELGVPRAEFERRLSQSPDLPVALLEAAFEGRLPDA